MTEELYFIIFLEDVGFRKITIPTNLHEMASLTNILYFILDL